MKKQPVAVFWNFNQLHERVLRRDHATVPPTQRHQYDQPGMVNVMGLNRFIRNRWDVRRSVAYANWQDLSIYASPLAESDVELVQLFPPRSKWMHQACERFQSDVEKLLDEQPDINIILIGADVSFVNCLDKFRNSGIQIVGINLRQRGDDDIEAGYREFIAYRDAAPPLRGQDNPAAAVRETHPALIDVLHRLGRNTAGEWVSPRLIQEELAQAFEAFDEQHYGYHSLAAYLQDQSKIVEWRRGAKRGEIEYRLWPQVSRRLKSEDAEDLYLLEEIDLYGRLAAQQGLRLPHPSLMWVGIDIYAAIIDDGESFSDFAALDEECLLQLRKEFDEAGMTDARKIRQILFKCYIFSPSNGHRIEFRDEVKTLEDVEDRYFSLLADRVAANVNGPVNWVAMSRAFTGEVGHGERMKSRYLSRVEATQT